MMSLFALFTRSSSKLSETLRQKMNLNNKNRELTFLAGEVSYDVKVEWYVLE